MTITYKEIPNTDGKYIIYPNGKIISRNWKRTKQDVEIKHQYNNKGYAWVRLKYNGKQKKAFLVHRLVAMVFIPNPENKPNVNHIDNNPLNNNIENLEWCTQKENVRYALKQKRYPRNENHYISKITFDIAEEIRKRYENETISHRHLASIYNISHMAIYQILKYKSYKCR